MHTLRLQLTRTKNRESTHNQSYIDCLRVQSFIKLPLTIYIIICPFWIYASSARVEYRATIRPTIQNVIQRNSHVLLRVTNNFLINKRSILNLFQVDAHNVVPCWIASDKQEYGARTIRKKIMDKLPEFLVEFPPVVKHPVIFLYECHGKFRTSSQRWSFNCIKLHP